MGVRDLEAGEVIGPLIVVKVLEIRLPEYSGRGAIA